MIAFKNRFHGHGSLRYVYQRGKTVHGQLLSLKYIRNNKRSEYRLAVVVSKKVSKSAVKRNRIRRRLYELARTSESPVGPFDLVVTVYSEQLIDLEHAELKKLLTSQFKQAGVIS